MRYGPVATLLLAGCLFDPSGLATVDADSRPEGRPDAAPERTLADQLVGDHAEERGPEASTDLPVTDAPPDLPGDLPSVVPLDAATLGNALLAATVPCVDKSGTLKGGAIPVADSAAVGLHDGQIALAGADPSTTSWVGGKPSVIVVFDVNACDDEAPSGSAEWGSAGLLVRGASLDGQGRLLLSPGAAVTDINAVDVNGDGTWQSEFCLPDDSQIPASYPQLLEPINKAKQLVIQLGTS